MSVAEICAKVLREERIPPEEALILHEQADLGTLAGADRARLLALLPEVAEDPHSYGGYARRNLTRSESALLHHGAA